MTPRCPKGGGRRKEQKDQAGKKERKKKKANFGGFDVALPSYHHPLQTPLPTLSHSFPPPSHAFPNLPHPPSLLPHPLFLTPLSLPLLNHPPIYTQSQRSQKQTAPPSNHSLQSTNPHTYSQSLSPFVRTVAGEHSHQLVDNQALEDGRPSQPRRHIHRHSVRQHVDEKEMNANFNQVQCEDSDLRLVTHQTETRTISASC